ncbi:MAG: hypothetical protein IT449_12550 [Phycisphaerales bacterium]|nr:hypothetical protein [Phycisphaerales bacterium]
MRIFAGLGWTLLLAAAARADINLEWRPVMQTHPVGATLRVGLYAVSDSAEDQYLAAVDVIFAWSPTHVRLLGNDDAGSPGWLYSGFPDDPYQLNESNPPQDGDGLYNALANFGEPVAATPEGTLLTTFEFLALADTPATILDILEEAGNPPGETVVYDAFIPNLDVTGTLGSAQFSIGPYDCGWVESTKLKYRYRANKLVYRFQLIPGIRRDWKVTGQLVGPDRTEVKSRRTSNRGRKRLKFDSQGPGLYTCAILEVEDPTGQRVCVGYFGEKQLVLP